MEKLNSLFLSILLGFELSYYLLIVQTGLVEHYNSDLIALFPMFVGGVLGSILAGFTWGRVSTVVDKIIIALSLQLILSFLYPSFNTFTLLLLGLAVGLMAPLSIYLFKSKQVKELLFALAIAYTVGTYFFTCSVEDRWMLSIVFSSLSLLSAMMLRSYSIDVQSKASSSSFIIYLPLVLWILLDSNLFESLLRDKSLNIWSSYTLSIIVFHLLGLVASYYVNISKIKEHIFIASLFVFSYIAYYFQNSSILATLYPFTISYYNVVIFRTLTKENSIKRLSIIMIFVGWIASGLGLSLAIMG